RRSSFFGAPGAPRGREEHRLSGPNYPLFFGSPPAPTGVPREGDARHAPPPPGDARPDGALPRREGRRARHAGRRPARPPLAAEGRGVPSGRDHLVGDDRQPQADLRPEPPAEEEVRLLLAPGRTPRDVPPGE